MELGPSTSGTPKERPPVIFIKFLFSPCFAPIRRPNVGQFCPSTSTQQDLENFVQFLISGVRSRDHPSITLDSPCIRLISSTEGSSRRQLNNPATRTSILADLGITRSTSVLVEHDCEKCFHIRQSGSATFCHSRLFPSGAIVDSDNNNEDNNAFPPKSFDTSRSFTAFLKRLFRTPRPVSQGPILSLRELCVNLLVKYIKVICGFDFRFYRSELFIPDNLSRLRVLSQQLGLAFLPVQLGAEIIKKLRRNYQLNATTLGLLKNFVYDLDLSHNQVSREMIFQLVTSWPALVGLNLANIPKVLCVEQLKIIAELKNLRYLNISGQAFVDGDVLKSLAVLPKLENLVITNTRYSECCWENLWRYHCSDGVTVSPLQVLAVNGAAFKDASLLAVVKLFPTLRVLNFRDTEVTGFYHSISDVGPLQELRFVVCSRKLVEFPQFLVPKITPGETEWGLIRTDVQKCNQLNIATFLDQIKGQPMQCIKGFTALSTVKWEDIQRLSEIDIPLKELDLSFLASSVPILKLAKIIKNLSKSLCKLDLPATNLEAVNNRFVDELVSSILMAKHLQEIDFGTQLRILSARQLIRIVLGLSALERIVARDMTEEQETELKKKLPPRCLLKIVKTPRDS
nr:DNA methylase C 5 cytosine specific active site [Hymenolepis microstoma]